MANDAASETKPEHGRGDFIRLADRSARRLLDDGLRDLLLRFIQPATGGVSIHPGQMARRRVSCTSRKRIAAQAIDRGIVHDHAGA